VVDLGTLTRIMSRKQIRSVFECTARINVWHGAVSSGKTVASLLAFLFAVVRAPENGLIFIVGRTLDTIGRNVIEPLQQPMGPFGPFARYVHWNRGANTAVIFGRVVHLVGANDVRAEGRIRGATAALMYIDEASLIPEAFWVMCLSRLRVPGARLLATTNPDAPLHWLRQNYLLRTDLNMRQWHFVLDDNPFLSREYVEDLKNEYTGLWYRRFILGLWCLAEGAVYDAWNPDVHVVKVLPHIVEWVGLGVDYGTTNPFAGELLGLGSDGALYFCSEYYYNAKLKHRQLSDHEYAKELLGWLDGVPIPGSTLRGVRPRWTAIDPSAASFRIELYQQGLPSVLADNAVLPGVRQFASLLATQRLYVHESCKALIAEIPGYSWDPKAAEEGRDEPQKVDDHCCDAGRYVVRTTEATWRNQLREPRLLQAA